MIIITWIIMIINVLGGVLQFSTTFTGKTISQRVTSFIGFVLDILTIMLCLYVIRC